MRWGFIAISPLVLAISTAPAAADYETIAPVRPLTMSDPSGLTVVGLDFQLTKWSVDLPAKTDFTSATIDVTADIDVSPHWVIFGRLPLSKLSVDPSNPGCCDFALSNFTLGARYLR